MGFGASLRSTSHHYPSHLDRLYHHNQLRRHCPLSYRTMESHSTSPYTNEPATSSRKGASRPHDKSSKPRSLLITHAAKKALVPVQRRSSLRMESLVPHMLDKSRYDAEWQHRKNVDRISTSDNHHTQRNGG